MCIENVTEKGLDIEGQGWKVFRRNEDGTIEGSDYHHNRVPVEKWYHKDECPVMEGLKDVELTYEPGFHVFEHKKDAVTWLMSAYREVVAHVRYRHGRVRGLQDIGTGTPAWVIVADEIYVYPDGH